jgi:TolA-binding protein
MRQRATALLVVEIQGLEQLLAATPRPSRDRPAILRRLAEDYVELEHGAERDRVAAQGHRQDGIARQKGMVANAARRTAIKEYTALIEDYDADPRLDEVFYDLALEDLQAGDDAQARRALHDLTTRFPDSRLVPSAAFLEGWLLSIAATADAASYRPAEEAFARAAGSSDALVAPVALRRLAWVARLAGDATAADEASRRLTSTYPASEAAAHPLAAGPGPSTP